MTTLISPYVPDLSSACMEVIPRGANEVARTTIGHKETKGVIMVVATVVGAITKGQITTIGETAIGARQLRAIMIGISRATTKQQTNGSLRIMPRQLTGQIAAMATASLPPVNGRQLVNRIPAQLGTLTPQPTTTTTLQAKRATTEEHLQDLSLRCGKEL
jgi:hypothetical protein